MTKNVAVLLGYFNGERYISSQIKSIFNQDYKDFDIYIFDDASESKFDISKLNFINAQKQKIKIKNRDKNVGYAYNFLEGLKSLPNNYKYYCFSDQDDIWMSFKLSTAINKIDKFQKQIPCLYGSRTKLVNKNISRTIGYSPCFKGPFNFKNALIQNFAGGNTMMMNLEAKKLISETHFSENIVSHDWWCYQLISGSGGKIIYDEKPSLLYRQHEDNVIGSNKGILAKILRFKKVIKGEFIHWNDINTQLLQINSRFLNKKNKVILERFIYVRKINNPFIRLFIFFRIGLFRQTFLSNISFFIAFLLKKV